MGISGNASDLAADMAAEMGGFVKMEKRERNRTAILSALSKATSPTSSTRLANVLGSGGFDLSERTVRLYLHELDEEGLTQRHGKRGRVITEQ
jgi:repressor of nif and glnA expression